ncbi:cytochrome d ubiquinol oxidase subunit II [Actinoallomurus bryophytorum]|uniref:Cytochrome bd-type quinol oxidase subunit 2 n=1 Tax=Actinoallomurus bryophytorum TaxID=1490222 RepID=A0A543CJN2_9ACTN|nr:cytochrome d ubiquinol oxidase subunit II [Actinoallomurus bryophytorum]TQL97306.1 cytochrome bd-type quinol oxidase subunit 2 [Actinoallomurus bryophytorum]
MDTLAYALLGFFTIGYFVLGGADIGVGMLLPFLGRDRRLTLATIAPFFLGNEVWLVATGGLLTSLFPGLEDKVFGRTWGALVVLIVGWIVRDMGLWLRGRRDESGWRRCWDAATVAGSWAVAASWGVAVGLLMGEGVPLFAVTTCSLFALYGAVFAALRLGSAVPRLLARRLVPVALVAGVPCAVGAGTDHLGRTVPFAAGLAVLLVLTWLAIGTGRYAAALAACALAIVVAPLLAAGNIPDATVGEDASLTIVVAGAMVPLLVAAQAWVWWTFRGRVEGPSYL